MSNNEKKSVRDDLWREYVRFPRYSWIVIGSKVKVMILFIRAFNNWMASHSEYDKEACFKYVADSITKEAMRISREGRTFIGTADKD